MKKALVFWMTGLSGSGKTTIANRFCELAEQEGKAICILDGDSIRSNMHRHLSFTPQDIKKNNKLIAQLCLNQMDNYDFVIVSIISPFAECRKIARQMIGDQFIEVYIKVSLDTAIERDAKGIYKKALNGKIENFIGISPNTPYESPEKADITLDTEKFSVDEAANILMEFVKSYVK